MKSTTKHRAEPPGCSVIYMVRGWSRDPAAVTQHQAAVSRGWRVLGCRG